MNTNCAQVTLKKRLEQVLVNERWRIVNLNSVDVTSGCCTKLRRRYNSLSMSGIRWWVDSPSGTLYVSVIGQIMKSNSVKALVFKRLQLAHVCGAVMPCHKAKDPLMPMKIVFALTSLYKSLFICAEWSVMCHDEAWWWLEVVMPIVAGASSLKTTQWPC